MNKTRLLPVFLLLSGVVRAAQAWIHLFYNYDKVKQLVAAGEFWKGHGIVLPYANPQDISQSIYEPLNAWAPGLSVLASPLVALLSPDLQTSAILLDALIAVFFTWTQYRLLRVLEIPAPTLYLCLFISSVFPYDFVFDASTDLLSVSFICWLIAETLIVIKKRHVPICQFILMAILTFAPTFFRYQYIPVTLLFTAYLFFYALANRLPSLIKASVAIWIFAVLATLLQWQWHGVSYGFSRLEKGWFPEDLVSLYPFLAAAFIHPELLLQAIGRFISFRYYMPLYHLLQTLTGLATLLLFFQLFKRGWRSSMTQRTLHQHAFLIGGAIFVYTCLLLLYLGLTSRYSSVPDHECRNYLALGRYFAAPILFIQYLLFAYPMKGRLGAAAKLSWVIVLATCLITGLQIARHLLRGKAVNETNAQFRDISLRLSREIPRWKKDGKPLVLVSYYDFITLPFAAPGTTVVSMNDAWWLRPLRTSRPVRMAYIIEKQFEPQFQQILRQPGWRRVLENSQWNVYLREVSTGPVNQPVK